MIREGARNDGNLASLRGPQRGGVVHRVPQQVERRVIEEETTEMREVSRRGELKPRKETTVGRERERERVAG
jgi:hypothetical protein